MQLSTSLRRRLRDIRAELECIDMQAPSALGWFIEELVALVGADSGFALQLTQKQSKLRVRSLVGHRAPVEGMHRSFDALFDDKPLGWTDWNHLRPEPSQRNRSVSAVRMLGWDAIEKVPAYQRVLVPNGLGKQDNLRVLVCDGPALLAWVGALRSEPFSTRELAIYEALVPALRERLIVERQLDADARPAADLAGALESISAPAFILDREGSVVHANAAGCARLDAHADAVVDELWAAVLGAQGRFTVSPIHSPGVAVQYLAVQKAPPAEDSARLKALRRGGTLSAREEELLSLLARGVPDETIATMLGCPRETVERQIAALMARYGCESRASLVTRVLSSSR